MHTLLIVDDEEIEREGMAQFIPWETYDMKVVGTARNGAEGLEKIAKYKPDLAIVDIKMPVMNGIEMIRKAREQYPDMTFVVLSGYGDYEFTSQAMELGEGPHFYEWMREFGDREEDRRIMLILNTDNHPDDDTLWRLMEQRWGE